MKEFMLEKFKELGITVTDEQYEKLEIYYDLLIEWNEVMNLTTITEKEEVFIKHFLDSFQLLYAAKDVNNKKLLDVGSGAGFPSIPMKILCPELNVTIIDSLNKRIKFLAALTKELNVDVELIHGRIEEHDRREYYDIVTARAVAKLNVLSELCLPYVKVNGVFLAFKGPNFEEEVAEALMPICRLGGLLVSDYTYPLAGQFRTILYIGKMSPTPIKYPRKFSVIKKSPLKL